MSGFSDLAAKNTLSLYTGQGQAALPAAVYLALFTTAPTTDSNTSTGTEVSGGSYARVQVAGSLACTAVTASTTITLSANAPAWLAALSNVSAGVGGGGVTVWTPAGGFIGTVAASGASTSSTTLTLTGTAAITGSTTIYLSAFSAPSASSGSEPSTTPASITNGASITFAQASASWGNANSFGLFDTLASTTNLLVWDYLGNFKWVPFSCTSASPGVLTVDNAADAPANGSSVVVTAKYGGTLPTGMTASGGVLTTAGLSGATFNVGVNTSSLGGGQVRQVLVQNIAINVTASFAAGTLTLTSA